MSGVAELFSGGSVVNKSGNVVDLKIHCAGKTVGIYFSAHWCPPCRGFTPALAKFYDKNTKDKNFEVIFVSCDQNESKFNEYFNEMPWLALSFNDKEIQEKLMAKYGVQGIPSLVIVNGNTGDIHTKDGRSNVGSDPDGNKLPWSN